MANELYDAVKEEIAGIIAKYKEVAKDGLTLPEIFSLITSATGSFVRVMEVSGRDGTVKKEAALIAAELFYDQVIAPLDIPHVPGFIETSVVDPALKKVFMAAVNGMIDSLVKIFNRSGWGDTGASADNGTSVGDAAAAPPGFVPY